MILEILLYRKGTPNLHTLSEVFAINTGVCTNQEHVLTGSVY